MRDLDFDTLARAVEVVSQETYLFHASVAENQRFAKPDATDAELEAAARDPIHEHIGALPDGYDTVVGERGHRFSGGEKQRLAIARTILRDPPVLVLDEATARWTPVRGRRAGCHRRPFRQPHHDHHRAPPVHRRDADRIVVLDSGRLAEQGRHEELAERDGRYTRPVRRDARLEPTR